MIKIENVVEPSGEQFQAVIRGMRNPMNSWKKSDSGYKHDDEFNSQCYELGQNDLELMQKLFKAGKDHRKFMRMIPVYVDITAPLYWWSEYDTYKVGTVANSCSKMHKIHAKKFTLDDFSHEHLLDCTIDVVIERVNFYRDLYIKQSNKDLYDENIVDAKTCWWQMIQLLPSSYNQKRTVMLNYEVLANMYYSRKNHKLDEWVQFCEWIETLPYFKEICQLECKGVSE